MNERIDAAVLARITTQASTAAELETWAQRFSGDFDEMQAAPRESLERLQEQDRISEVQGCWYRV